MDDREICTRIRLEARVLERWVAAGWLIPDRQAGTPEYSEIDLARGHLIRDLQDNVGVNDEGVEVILHLLDQLHGLRRTMSDLLVTLRAQPDQLREQLASDLERALNRRSSSGDDERAD